MPRNMEELRTIAQTRNTGIASRAVEVLIEERNARGSRVDEIIARCTVDHRDLTASEKRDFDRARTEAEELDSLIDAARDPLDRAAAAADVARRFKPRDGAEAESRVESRVYNRETAQKRSFFRDLALVQFTNDVEARQRLDTFSQEQRVNPNRTDGQGGYFVPPTWLIDQYVPLARAGRPFAEQCVQFALPGGTDSINIPKVASGGTVAAQTADGGPVSSTDITDTSVSSSVITLAGQQDFSLQLLEQSPMPGFDQVVAGDLTRALYVQVDKQCLGGSGASGQVQGIDGLSGTTSVAYTDASPTGGELYLPLMQAVNAIAANIFLPATHIWMHPRRWYWLSSQLDSQNRPLVQSYGRGAFNPLASMGENAAQGGPAGNIGGVDVWLDPNITTTAGGGTEDRIYVTRQDQIFLWEGELRVRALQEVLSGTLQVRLQVYEYMAYIAARYPKAISVVSGTGLAAPAGF